MSKPSHLELHDAESEATLCHLDSVSLPSEPPDIRNLFSSYIYESPQLDSFQDSDGARENCHGEEIDGKSGNNNCLGDGDDACTAALLKLSQSESIQLLSEPPDIRNWFSSYVYESLPLDTACDFAISDNEDVEDGMLYVGEKSSSHNRKHSMASISAEKTKLCTEMDASDGAVKGPNLAVDARLYHQSVCKENEGVDLLPSSSAPSLTIADKAFDLTLSKERAVYSSHNSLERGPSTLHPASINKTNNIGSEDGKPVHRSVKESKCIGDFPENDTTASPQTTDRRSIEETELTEDGFISVRKRSRGANDENAARFTNGVKPMLNHEKNDGIVRKVLSEISNSHYQNIVGSTGKWSCPQKNKPELGPPLKQLRLDQWVRRV